MEIGGCQYFSVIVLVSKPVLARKWLKMLGFPMCRCWDRVNRSSDFTAHADLRSFRECGQAKHERGLSMVPRFGKALAMLDQHLMFICETDCSFSERQA